MADKKKKKSTVRLVHVNEPFSSPFLDPTYDITFKRVFANEQHKEITIDFLNDILERPEGKKISSLVFNKQENIPELNTLAKTIIDIRCSDQTGAHYIVEMQLAPQKDFLKRSELYTATVFSQQHLKNDSCESLQPVIFVAISSNLLFGPEEDYLTHVYKTSAKTNKKVMDGEEWHYIELPKFLMELEWVKTPRERWVYFLKHAKDLSDVPAQFADDEPVSEAFELLRRMRFSSKELQAYNRVQDARRVAKSVLETAKEEGEARGEVKTANRIAKNLLSQGVAVTTICQATGLTKKEIVALKKS